MAGLFVNVLLIALVAAAQPAPPQATGRVTGRVIDAETGDPVVGARVTLVFTPVVQRPAAGQVPPTPTPIPPLTSETNANGVYDITGVPPGRWRVTAQKTGFVPHGANAPPMEMSGGGVTAPEIRLDRGGAIEGRLLDQKGIPLSGVTVRSLQFVRAADGTVRPGGGGSSVQTNDLGEFRLAGLPPGQHYVIAQPRFLARIDARFPTFYPGFADAASASPINVGRGLTTNGIDFSMLVVGAFQVSGMVVDSSGRAVAGAIVQLLDPRTATAFAMQGRPSAADGTFRVLNVPSGTYKAMAAIPVVIRNGNSTSTSLTFGATAAKGAVEVVVQGANLGGVRVVVQQ